MQPFTYSLQKQGDLHIDFCMLVLSCNPTGVTQEGMEFASKMRDLIRAMEEDKGIPMNTKELSSDEVKQKIAEAMNWQKQKIDMQMKEKEMNKKEKAAQAKKEKALKKAKAKKKTQKGKDPIMTPGNQWVSKEKEMCKIRFVNPCVCVACLATAG